MLKRDARAWPVPAALILYALLPIVMSSIRLFEIASGPVETADNARFLVMPIQIYLHGGGGVLYLILGAFQFSQLLRMRFPKWHRWNGRVAVIAGALAALSAVWMTETMPQEPFNPHEVYGFRILFGLAWFWCLALGLYAAINRDIASHRAWMMRAYAIAIGASTTAIIQGVWFVFYGMPSPKVFALATGAAWVINLIVVQRIISPAVRFDWSAQARMRM
ncbi:MAG: DUF2306 domain-containing protein [Notoacmeibacter sp.]